MELQDKLFCIQVTIVCTVTITKTDHLTGFIVTAIEMMHYSLFFDMCSLSTVLYKLLKQFIITNDNSRAAFVHFIISNMIKVNRIRNDLVIENIQHQTSSVIDVAVSKQNERTFVPSKGQLWYEIFVSDQVQQSITHHVSMRLTTSIKNEYLTFQNEM